MACGATHGVADRPLLVAFCGKGMEQTHTQLCGLGGEECVRNVSASALAGNLWIRYVVNFTFSMDCHSSTGRCAAHPAVFRGKCWSSPTIPADQRQSHPCKPHARWNTSGRLWQAALLLNLAL